MVYSLKWLVEHSHESMCERSGRWTPARPLAGPFIERVKAAWMVLLGKADAFTWPEGQ